VKECVARDIPAPGNPVSTGSIAAHPFRMDAAQWAPEEVTASYAFIHRLQKLCA
jgi:hypothetical protein